MPKRFFKKNNPHKITELENDLVRFNEEWYQIQTEKTVIDNKKFLTLLADDILKLDRHAKEVEELGEWKSGAKLIHFILHTPWGAPFVSPTTLLDAAISFPDELPLKSSLHDLLKLFTQYSTKCQIPIIENLKELREEIKKYKSL